MLDSSTTSAQSLIFYTRTLAKLNSLKQQYPGLTVDQLLTFFALYWTDDLDLVLFYNCMEAQFKGHLTLNGLNFSLEPALPIAGWFSGLDEKVLAGRALFERTFRERKELITSLLKSKMSDSLPIRVILKCQADTKLDGDYVVFPVTFLIANTSWMHQVEFDFDVNDAYS